METQGGDGANAVVLNITPAYPFSTNVTVHVWQSCLGWGETTAYKDFGTAYYVSNNISAGGLVTNFSVCENALISAVGGLSASTAYGLEWSVSGP